MIYWSGGRTYFNKFGTQTWSGHFYFPSFVLNIFVCYSKKRVSPKFFKLVIFFEEAFSKGILRFSRSKKSNFQHFADTTPKLGQDMSVCPYTLYRPCSNRSCKLCYGKYLYIHATNNSVRPRQKLLGGPNMGSCSRSELITFVISG